MGKGAESGVPVAILGVMDRLFDVAAARMSAAIDQLEQGGPAEVRSAQRAIRELQRALWLLVDERTRVDKLRSKIVGAIGGADRHDGEDDGRKLDLDAARDEIGRRLAVLRATSDGG